MKCFLPDKDYDRQLKKAEEQAKLFIKISKECKKGKYGKAASLLGKMIIARTEICDF